MMSRLKAGGREHHYTHRFSHRHSINPRRGTVAGRSGDHEITLGSVVGELIESMDARARLGVTFTILSILKNIRNTVRNDTLGFAVSTSPSRGNLG